MIDYRADPEFYQGFLGCAGFAIEPCEKDARDSRRSIREDCVNLVRLY
jgi:hypothetical protein